jgi:protein-L-isoaspartate(D-aspartate) O-methyltransferase
VADLSLHDTRHCRQICFAKLKPKDDNFLMNENRKNNDDAARLQMVTLDLQGRDITDPDVLKVMAEIPREEFIPEQYRSQAYSDGPLPIGIGQTISQPYIVALMTQSLKLKPDFEVLEIGTGSGYQTAVLSRLAKKVCTIERFSKFSQSAQAVIERLGFNNVEFYIGDGSRGWHEKKLFDRIIITAAVPQMPEPVLGQLKIGGLFVAPIGGSSTQSLILGEKKPVGCTESFICNVRFVKLVGEFAFNE